MTVALCVRAGCDEARRGGRGARPRVADAQYVGAACLAACAAVPARPHRGCDAQPAATGAVKEVAYTRFTREVKRVKFEHRRAPSASRSRDRLMPAAGHARAHDQIRQAQVPEYQGEQVIGEPDGLWLSCVICLGSRCVMRPGSRCVSRWRGRLDDRRGAWHRALRAACRGSFLHASARLRGLADAAAVVCDTTATTLVRVGIGGPGSLRHSCTSDCANEQKSDPCVGAKVSITTSCRGIGECIFGFICSKVRNRNGFSNAESRDFCASRARIAMARWALAALAAAVLACALPAAGAAAAGATECQACTHAIGELMKQVPLLSRAGARADDKAMALADALPSMCAGNVFSGLENGPALAAACEVFAAADTVEAALLEGQGSAAVCAGARPRGPLRARVRAAPAAYCARAGPRRSQLPAQASPTVTASPWRGRSSGTRSRAGSRWTRRRRARCTTPRTRRRRACAYAFPVWAPIRHKQTAASRGRGVGTRRR